MKRYLALFICLIALTSFGQQDPLLKKLGIYDQGRSNKATVQSIDKLNGIIKDTVYSNAEKAANYARISYHLSKKIEYAKGEVEAMYYLSRAKIYSNQLDSALMFTRLGLSIAEKNKLNELTISGHQVLGGVYSYQGDYEKASKEYFETIKIAEKVDKRLALNSYANLGHVFKMINNLEKSRKYSEKAYSMAKEYKDTSIIVFTLNLIGLVDFHERKFDSALKVYAEGLKYARQIGDIERQGQLLYNISNVYFELKDYTKGLPYFYESLEISKVNDSYASIGIGFQSIAEVHLDLGDLINADASADSAIYYGLLSKNYQLITESYEVKSRVSVAKHQLKDALDYLNKAYLYKDSMNLTELNGAALDAEDNFEKEKKQLADSLYKVQVALEAANTKKVNDQKMRSREILLWISGLALLIVTFGIYFLYKNNKLIKAQNKLVNTQKEEIQVQHTEIKDSINYAQRIQQAIISRENEWNSISQDHFILFKPKNVVSGDFYWAHHNITKNISVWAVADCTGHGVPGAFMSMLGIGFLNEIIIENGIVNPSEILEHLRTKIIAALRQKEGASQDGMDISICVWDKNQGTLEYAGANNPLWLIRKGTLKNPEIVKQSYSLNNSELQLHEIAPDKMPIGYFLKIPPPFTTQKIELENDDTLVLISDGFADQFGGEQGKKFRYQALKDLLLEIQVLPTSQQAEKLNAVFEKWRGNEEQTDDVCIVGVKIKR